MTELWDRYYAGSSPRAWGTLLAFGCRVDRHRFIPTCMGNSIQQSESEMQFSVHPHVHGELFHYKKDLI